MNKKEMISKTTVIEDANLCNTINKKGLFMANKGKKINRSVMLSNYTKEVINDCWESLTINVIQNYEKGKGTNIKGFGTFTYKRDWTNLEGTTNEYFRDKRESQPVFILSKDFNKCCLPGEFTQLNAIRYYKQKENKNIPIMPLNYSEISYRLSMSKDEVENIISNLIKNISDSVSEGTFKNKIFPNLGILFIKYNILAVKFYDDFIDRIKYKNDKFIKSKKFAPLNTDFNFNKSLTSRKNYKTINEFLDNDLKAENSLNTVLDKSCCDYLKSEYNIDINQIPEHKLKNIYKSYEENEGKIDFINDYSPTRTRNKRKNDLLSSPLFTLDEESITSFEYYKGVLIFNAKKYDINKYGTITKDEAVSILLNSNISDKIDANLAEKIVEFYNKTDKVEYMKFIAKIIKDIQNYTTLKCNKNDKSNLNSTEIKKDSLPNLINNMKNGKKILTKSYSNTFYITKKLNISKTPKASTKDNEEKLPYIKSKRLKFNSNLRYIQEESKNDENAGGVSSEEEKDIDILNSQINIDEIKSMINTIKSILPDLRQKYLTSISQNISSFELLNILKKYTISYPKNDLDSLLNFIGIKDVQAFSLEDFMFFIKKCKVAETKFNKKDLNPIIDKLKDIIYVNGGVNFLFKNGDNIPLTCDNFVKILKEKANYEYDLLKDLFYYMVKTDRAFTINDYFKYFENDKTNLSEEYYIEKMKLIINEINNKHLTPEEYFSHLLSYNTSTKDKFITRLNWINYLKKEKINLSSRDSDNLFLWIDTKKDNLIDRDEFLSKYNFTTKPLTVFKDIIYNNKLDIEDLAHRMNMNMNEIKQLNYEEFRDKIKKIDFTLAESFIQSMFDELKNNEKNLDNDVIEQKKFLKEINYKKEDFYEKNKNKYFSEIYREAIRKKIKYEELKRLFEKRDETSLGLLTKTDYVSVISKIVPEYNDDDHLVYIRITDSLDMNTSKVIYSKILNSIYFFIPEKQNDEFIKLCQILSQILLKECDNDLEKLFNYINKGIIKKSYFIGTIKPLTLEQILKFLKEKYNQSISEKAILKFDVDSDGVISYEDMKSVLKRFNVTNFFKYNNKVSNPQIQFFTKENLSEDKNKSIILSLYNYMKAKNLTEIGLFKKLDKDGDGFISNVELNEGLDDIVKLNSNIKDQFFNFLDYYKNGMVDLNTFISRLTNPENNYRLNYLCQNNNKKENEILEEFKLYCQKNKDFSDTEIYKILDKDCDGIINYSDFENFVINILKIPQEEFNKENIERVMMTLSLSKNLQIGLNDIREFIENSNKQNDHMNLKQVFKITSSQNLSELKKNKEWTNDIIERFGMFISEKFDSIQQFFEQNTTPGSGKFKFEDFLKFQQDNLDLFGNGFNLTTDELLSIFTSLDSQKKNYLTLQDLENKLQIFNFYNKMHIDIKNFLQQNFENGVDAFKYFMKKNKEKKEVKILICEEDKNNTINKKYSISIKDFFDTFENFFPKKYATNTILKYLNKYFRISIPNSPNFLTERKEIINFDEFNYLYFDKLENNQKFISKKNNETKLLTNRHSFSKDVRKTFLKRSSSMLNSLHIKNKNYSNNKKSYTNLNALSTPFDSEPLNKLKRIIFSSKLNLMNFFETMSKKTDNQNCLNKYIFRTMIKNFKIGLTNLEIDSILSKCATNSYDGKVNFKEFIQFLKGQSIILNEGNQNIAQFIGEIKSLIYKYYSNPIICFQNNDKDNTGKIDFEKFKTVIFDMYSRENQKLPNFALVKNAYDTLDLRKDGIIDIKEWCIAFASYNSKLDSDADKIPNGPEFFNNKKNKCINTENTNFGHNRIALREWETSDEVVDIYLFIHKNRKLVKNSIYKSGFSVINENENFIHSENLINILRDLIPNHKLSQVQWKMIVNIAQNENYNNLIDIEKFFRIIEITAKNMMSQPKLINIEKLRTINKNKLRRTISEKSLLQRDIFANNNCERINKKNTNTNIYKPKINLVNMINFKNVVLPGEKKLKIKSKNSSDKING